MKNKTTIYFEKINTDKLNSFHNMVRNTIKNWGLSDCSTNREIMKQFYSTFHVEESKIADKIKQEAKNIKTAFSSIPEELICDFIILARFVFNNDIKFEKPIGIYPVFSNSNKINSYALVFEADEKLNIFGIHSRLNALCKFVTNGCSAVYIGNECVRRSVYNAKEKRFKIVTMQTTDAVSALQHLIFNHAFEVNQALNKNADKIALLTGEFTEKKETQ